MRRPSALVGENIVGSKKLLLAICNVEYVLSCSVPALCRRLSENGVKYSDVVFEVLSAHLSYAQWHKRRICT